MRDWVTDPKKANFGITIRGQSRNLVSIASHLHTDANMRPRLSLSCHGDRVAAEAVFKEKHVSLKTTVAKKHKNVKVNNKIVTKNSYILKPGDLISIDQKLHKLILNNVYNSHFWPIPPKYLDINYKTFEGGKRFAAL
jgi:ribosomal 50S subunit-recycling heat shock protein